MRSEFPPVDEADEDGLLAIGGDLEVETLLFAYQNGIFPWPFSERDPIPWFAPPKRALLFLDKVHLSRSLKKTVSQHRFVLSFNQHFGAVIQACAKAKNRKGQRGTWITSEMISAYTRLHEAGYAYSVEAVSEGRLVGGLYGVNIQGFCGGESMFYEEPNASKCCVLALIEYLRQREVPWIDCQQLTPFFKKLGARLVERDEFMSLLAESLARPGRLFDDTARTFQP